jgi:hypothetical protein
MPTERHGGSRRSLLSLLLSSLFLLFLFSPPARASHQSPHPWLFHRSGDVMGFGEQLRRSGTPRGLRGRPMVLSSSPHARARLEVLTRRPPNPQNTKPNDSLAHLAQTVARALDNNNTCPASSSDDLPIPSHPSHCAIPDGHTSCSCAANCRAERGGGPNSSQSVHFLLSPRYKIGLDASKGGGICYLSLLTPQNSFQGRNLLNAFDAGRFIQQSWYGDEDGSDWNGRSWRWNPVMGGSWQNKPSKVLFCGPVAMGENGATQKRQQLVAALHPRNWAGQQLLEDCLMTTAVRFLAEDPHLIHVRQTFSYSAKGKRHQRRTQELPAVFCDRRLGELVFFDGPQPWTGRPLRRERPGPQPPNSYYPCPTERFAAYVNENDVGVGVFCPQASGALTAYRVGGDGSAQASDTSYFALTVDRAIVPGETIAYDCWIAAGPMPEIRAAFRRQAVRLGLAAAAG